MWHHYTGGELGSEQFRMVSMVDEAFQLIQVVNTILQRTFTQMNLTVFKHTIRLSEKPQRWYLQGRIMITPYLRPLATPNQSSCVRQAGIICKLSLSYKGILISTSLRIALSVRYTGSQLLTLIRVRQTIVQSECCVHANCLLESILRT